MPGFTLYHKDRYQNKQRPVTSDQTNKMMDVHKTLQRICPSLIKKTASALIGLCFLHVVSEYCDQVPMPRLIRVLYSCDTGNFAGSVTSTQKHICQVSKLYDSEVRAHIRLMTLLIPMFTTQYHDTPHRKTCLQAFTTNDTYFFFGYH